jgi:hypothetical protein
MSIVKKTGGRLAGGPVSGSLAWVPASLLAALLLGACAQERVAGGDDFPNSVETLGKEGSAQRSDSTEWNAYKSAPDTAPGLYDTTYTPDTIPRDDGGLLKPGLLPGDGLPIGAVIPGRDLPGAFRTLDTLLDLVTGVTRVVRTQGVAGLQVRDTTWYRRDSLAALVLLRVAGRVEGGGIVKLFAFEDGDGNGILSARAGSANIMVIRSSSTASDGSVGERSLRIAAGPDRNFNQRADNSTLAYSETLRKGVDTLLSLLLRDADGDGLIFSPLRDTNLVDVDRVSDDGVSSGARLSLHYRLAAFADRSRNRPVRFRRVLETSAGVTETIALGRDSLPDFAPGDTGRVLVSFASSVTADTLQRATADYRVKLSDTAGRFTGNRLLRVDRSRALRFGAATGARYTLWPEAPVPDGSFARDGSVVLRVDLRAGGWIGFTGISTAAGWSGTWIDETGGGGTVHFDAAGRVTSASSSP